jgi:hypothetical protein
MEIGSAGEAKMPSGGRGWCHTGMKPRQTSPTRMTEARTGSTSRRPKYVYTFVTHIARDIAQVLSHAITQPQCGEN